MMEKSDENGLIKILTKKWLWPINWLSLSRWKLPIQLLSALLFFSQSEYLGLIIMFTLFSFLYIVSKTNTITERTIKQILTELFHIDSCLELWKILIWEFLVEYANFMNASSNINVYVISHLFLTRNQSILLENSKCLAYIHPYKITSNIYISFVFMSHKPNGRIHFLT